MTPQEKTCCNNTPGAVLRREFPLLVKGDEQGLVYLDNAATTQKPSCVLDAMDDFYLASNANPHRSLHRLADAATNAYEEARAEVARFFGADANELVFTGGATHALNMAALSYGAHMLKPGDEVVLSLLEHHSDLVPWQTVARLCGAKVNYLVPNRCGTVTDAEIERVIGPKTRIVAITQASNVLGCMPPIERVVQAAHEHGAAVVLDCAQSAAHLPIDVHALDVDFAAFSAHKMFGPMGIGALYARKKLLDQMEPLLTGGGMVDTVFEQTSSFIGGPRGFEAGTQNVAGAVGFAEAARFLARTGFLAIRAHEAALTKRMVEGLEAIPSIKLYGSASNCDDARCGIVSFNVRGVDAPIAARMLDRKGVAVRAGTHCAQPLLRHLGTTATCRASLALYNTEQDVDRFLEASETAQKDAVAYTTSLML